MYGGNAEISSVVARQLGCKDGSDEVMGLWIGGMEAGEAASWTSISDHKPLMPFVRLHLTIDFLQNQVPTPISELAAAYYPAQRNSRRLPLAYKAASILHKVYQCEGYNHIDEAHFRSSMALVLVSMAVGCLKSLVQSPPDRLSSFSWTLDCRQNDEDEDDEDQGILSFCERMLTFGMIPSEIMWMAACVWGGSDSSHRSDVLDHQEVMGIVCPQLTILLNVLSDPKSVAGFGLASGFMSFHEGSLPMLPRDPISGHVLAGNAKSGLERRFIRGHSAGTPTEVEPGQL